MLGGGRQRRMVSLGKVTAPKPVNLPSQRKENNGNDPSVNLVSKPGAGWSDPSPGGGTPGGASGGADGDAPKLPPRVIPAQPAPAWGGAGLPDERRRALELASREQFPTLDAAAGGPDDPRHRPSRSRSPHGAWDDDDRGPYAPPPYGGDRRYGPGPERYGPDADFHHHHHGRERYGRGPYDRGYDRGGPYDRDDRGPGGGGGGYYERERYGPPPPRDFRDEPPPYEREREDFYGGPRRGGPYGGGPEDPHRDFSPDYPHGPPRGGGPGGGGHFRGRDRGGDFYPPRRGRADYYDGPPPQPGRRGDFREGPPPASPHAADVDAHGDGPPGPQRRRDSGAYRRGGPGTPPHPRGGRGYEADEGYAPIVPPPPPPPPPPRRKPGEPGADGAATSAASAAGPGGLDRSASGVSGGAESEALSRRATAGSSVAPSLVRSEVGSVTSMLTGDDGSGAVGEAGGPGAPPPSYASAANGEAESAPPGHRGATPTRILKRPGPQGLVPPGGMAPVGAAAAPLPPAQLPPSAALQGLTLDSAPAEVSFMAPLAPPQAAGQGVGGLGGAPVARTSMPPALQGLSLQLGSAFPDASGLFAAPAGGQQPLATFGPGGAGAGGLGGLSLGLAQVSAAAAPLSGPPPLQFGDILLPSAIDGSVEPDAATPPNAGGRHLLGDLGAQFGGAGDKAGAAGGDQQRKDGKKQRGGRGRGGRGAAAAAAEGSAARPPATVLVVPPPPPPPPPAGAPSTQSQGDAKGKTRRGGRRRKSGAEGAAGDVQQGAPAPGAGDAQQGEGRSKRRGGAGAGAGAGTKAGSDKPAAPPGLQLPAEGGAGGDDGDGGKGGRKTRGGRGKRRGRGGGEGGEGGAPTDGGAPSEGGASKAGSSKASRSRGGSGGKGAGSAAPPPPPPRPPAAA